MSRIRVLDLTIDTNRVETPISWSGLRRLLTTSPHLATLKLRSRSARAVRLIPERLRKAFGDLELTKIITGSFMPGLQHADLKLSFHSRAEVVAFIQRHRGSLQQLHLHEAGIGFL
jgi:hypothetical protein